MEWISVEDELPDPNLEEFYFVLLDDGDPECFGLPEISCWIVGATWVETGEYCDPYWEIEDEQEDKVSYWMPQPKRPTKKPV